MTKPKTSVADFTESERSPFAGWEPSLEARAERRLRTLLFIPRFRLASSRRALRTLRNTLSTSRGYTVALGDSSSTVDAIVDIVIFTEALSKAVVNDDDGPAARSPDRANFARTILESIESTFCMVLDGNDTYLTNNVQPLVQKVLERASVVVVGAVWQTHRPEAPSRRLPGLRRWLKGLFPRERHRDVLSGLFVVEGGHPWTTNASSFVGRTVSYGNDARATVRGDCRS